MLYDVHYKTDTADRGVAQVEAANEAEATVWAEQQGWEVEHLRPTPVDRRSTPNAVPVNETPEYAALLIWSGILRLLGVVIAGAGLFLLFDSPARETTSSAGFPLWMIVGFCILAGLEVYVCGEAVAAFRHLVQNSWAWRQRK